MRNNLLKYFFLGLFIFFLLLPRSASADFLGIVDLMKAALEGVEETVHPILMRAVKFVFYYIIGIIALLLSGTLLQHVITHQAEWLSVQPLNSPLVASGFSFTSGLANLLMILIFLVIAFAFIFKIETFQFKKALIRLIIVALLLNFSLVFIGMALDISNIIYSTILNRLTFQPGETQDPNQVGDSLLALTTERLVGPIWQQLLTMIGWLSLRTIMFSIPGVSIGSQLAIVLTLETAFLPNILIWIMQLVTIFLISGTFFLYAFLFVARVFVIQILAILSPLAFLCLILPQTEKYWRRWLDHFLEWLFLGISLLFFLVLGLRAAGEILPPGSVAQTQGLIPGVSWFHIQDYIVYYLFLFIYLLITGWISHQAAPILAATLIGGAALWGKVAWGHAIRPMAGGIVKEARKAWAVPGRPEGWKEKMRERFKHWSEAPAPELKGKKVALAPIAIAYWATKRGLGKQLSIAPLEAEMKTIKEGEERAKKMETPQLALTELRGALAGKDLAKAIGLLSQAIEKGGGFKKLMEKELTPEEAIRLGQYANKIGVGKEAERIGRLFAHQKEVIEKMEFGPLTDEEKAKGYENIQQKLISEARGDEVRDFTKGFWKNDETMRAIQQFWGGPQISKAADIFGREFVEDYSKVTRQLTAEQLIRVNPRAALYLSGTAAQDLGFESVKGLSRGAIREKIKEARERGEAGILTSKDVATLKEAIQQAGFKAAPTSSSPSSSKPPPEERGEPGGPGPEERGG